MDQKQHWISPAHNPSRLPIPVSGTLSQACWSHRGTSPQKQLYLLKTPLISSNNGKVTFLAPGSVSRPISRRDLRGWFQQMLVSYATLPLASIHSVAATPHVIDCHLNFELLTCEAGKKTTWEATNRHRCPLTYLLAVFLFFSPLPVYQERTGTWSNLSGPVCGVMHGLMLRPA